MKRITTILMLLMLVCMGTWAYSGIKLTFNRVDAGSGTATNAVSDVTVNVTDTYGNALPGITATLASTSITELKTGSAAALGRTTNSVLAPNAGYANEQNSTIEYVFCVTGLDTEFAYNKVALDVYALTGGGGQQNPNDTQREWTFDISTGETAGGVASFISQSGNEICADGTSLSDGLYHKNWEMTAGSEKAATATLYIKVVLTRTASLGCYAGLAGVTLSGGRKWESKEGWEQASGGVGSVSWFGMHTPGDASTMYSLTSINVMQESGNSNNDNYLAIARVSPTSTLRASDVVAISDNHLSASQSTASLETYNFSEGVNLLGGTTYYIVFLSSNTPSDGSYSVRTSRLSVNHNDYGTYTYGCSSASWWPYAKALLDFSATTGYCVGDLLSGTISGSNNFTNTWTSGTSPAFTLTSSAANINHKDDRTTGGLDIRSGSAQSATYTIKAPAGYLITGYKLFGKALASNQTVTPAEGGSAVVFTTVGNSLRVTGLKKTSTSFVLTGANDGLYLHAMEVNLSPCSSITSLPTDNDKVYVITNARGTWNFANDATAMTAVAAGDLNNVQQHVALIYNDENYYLYSVNAGKYLTASNTLTVVPSENEQIAIEATGNATYPWFFKFKNVSGKNFNVDGNQKVFINTWGTIDAGNSNAILPVGSYDLTQAVKNLTKGKYVTYKVYYNDTEVLSEDNVLVYIDDAPNLPTSMQRDYCTYTYYSDEERTKELDAVTSSSNTIYVNATWDGPFKLFSDYASIDEWKFLKLKNSRYVTYEEESDPNVTLNQTVGTVDTRWAFVGDPYTGIRLYNKTAGGDKVLASNGREASDGNSGGKTYTRLVAVDDATYTHNCWFPKVGDASISNGFYLYDDLNYALNLRAAGNLAYWTGGTGTGSTFSVEAADLDFASEVTNYASYFITDNYGKYFSISQSVAESLQDDYVSYSSSCTEDQFISLRNSIISNIILPETGYYRLKNNNAAYYLGATSNLAGFASGTGPETIVRLTKNNDGTYNMQVQSQYVNQSASQYGGQLRLSNNAEALQYTIPSAGTVVFSFASGNWTHNSLNLNEGIIRNYTPGDDASVWKLEDATSATVSLTPIGGNTYATTYLPFDVTVSGSDVTANAVVVADVHVGYVVPTALEYNKIPAGTPVILKGSSTSATSATLNINTGDAFSAISRTSALEGVYVNTDFSLSETDDESNSCTADYFLGMLDGALGFYHSAIETPASSGNYTLSANRAYLPASQVAASRGFAIKWNDDEITGIGDASHLKQKAESRKQMFDLQGRRVENPQRGLYIVGGRKIVIK